MNDIFITVCIVVGGACLALGYILGEALIYRDCQNVGVFYTASKVYECKERK